MTTPHCLHCRLKEYDLVLKLGKRRMNPQREGVGNVDVSTGKLTKGWKTSKDYSPLFYCRAKGYVFVKRIENVI